MFEEEKGKRERETNRIPVFHPNRTLVTTLNSHFTHQILLFFALSVRVGSHLSLRNKVGAVLSTAVLYLRNVCVWFGLVESIKLLKFAFE